MCTAWGRMQMQVLAKLLRQRWPHAAHALPRRRRCDTDMVFAGRAWSSKGISFIITTKLWACMRRASLNSSSSNVSACAPALQQLLAVPVVRAGSQELAPCKCVALAMMCCRQFKWAQDNKKPLVSAGWVHDCIGGSVLRGLADLLRRLLFKSSSF